MVMETDADVQCRRKMVIKRREIEGRYGGRGVRGGYGRGGPED